MRWHEDLRPWCAFGHREVNNLPGKRKLPCSNGLVSSLPLSTSTTLSSLVFTFHLGEEEECVVCDHESSMEDVAICGERTVMKMTLGRQRQVGLLSLFRVEKVKQQIT